MNIADNFTNIANKYHQKEAVRFPQRVGKNYRYDSITFGELETLSNKYANGLSKIGFTRGCKTLLFIRPSLQFHALVFALFKLGVVPVLIDPGMGMKNLLAAVEEIAPQGLIAEPEVHLLSLICRRAFKSIKFKVTTKGPQILGYFPLKVLERSQEKFTAVAMAADEMAAILFTSGGTGRPKGVVYTHKIFCEQTRILQELFGLSDGEVDLPCFPLFSLFTLCMGMTSCIPDMDAARPSKADPLKLLQNINDNKVTFVAGSPAIWERLANYCQKNSIKLPYVTYVVMFGAPVRNEIHKMFHNILPNGTTYTPYGATECLPISNISGKLILAQTATLTEEGKGTCVGKPVSGVKVSIISIDDGIIADIKQAQRLATNQIGEIIVQGKVVTASYYQASAETSQAKIFDNDSIWHRTGDLGYTDDEGRIWFCGRKTHRAETPLGLVCSVTSEAIFNTHRGIR
ncbi:MAG: fatty acid CoA ligase family protein, partial [Pseudomonadota bacterium]